MISVDWTKCNWLAFDSLAKAYAFMWYNVGKYHNMKCIPWRAGKFICRVTWS